MKDYNTMIEELSASLSKRESDTQEKHIPTKAEIQMFTEWQQIPEMSREAIRLLCEELRKTKEQLVNAKIEQLNELREQKRLEVEMIKQNRKGDFPFFNLSFTREQMDAVIDYLTKRWNL